jgi:hypothetical protein
MRGQDPCACLVGGRHSCSETWTGIATRHPACVSTGFGTAQRIDIAEPSRLFPSPARRRRPGRSAVPLPPERIQVVGRRKVSQLPLGDDPPNSLPLSVGRPLDVAAYITVLHGYQLRANGLAGNRDRQATFRVGQATRTCSHSENVVDTRVADAATAVERQSAAAGPTPPTSTTRWSSGCRRFGCSP